MSALNNSEFNQWGANRYQIAEEIGAVNLFGNNLANRIDKSFQVNATTPEVIRQDIQNINEELDKFNNALEGLKQSFEAFEIGTEVLAPGEGEIGIVIPRDPNEILSDFAKDLKRFNYEINVLARVATSTTQSFKIRTISSSNFVVFLASIPDIVIFISNIITALRFGYEKLQQLKKVLDNLRELGNTSDKTIIDLEKDVETAMEKEVANVIKEIQPMYKTAVENGLAEEGFEIELKSAIKGLASRIDRGYNFSFRIGPPKVKKDEQPTEKQTKLMEVAKNVAKNNRKLQQAKMIEPGQQVLPLEWQTPDPED